MNTDSLILRQTDNAPLINKDDTLTSAEFDANVIKIYEDFLALSNANDSTLEFDVDRSYLVGEYSTYGGRMWISTNNSTGSTPTIDSYDWQDIFPTVLAHEKNKDTILDEGGVNETTVAEIRAFIDAGLTSTTNLSLTTKTPTSFKIESSTGTDVTIPQATDVDAGLLNATDKVKLNNLTGINSGDQTLVSLNAEDVDNKATDFTTINDTLYPTTQAVDTYVTTVVPDLVETFINSNVELTTNKAIDFITINDTLYPSVKAVDDQLDFKVDKVVGSRLITSAESTLLGNTSGTNTGDQDLSGLMVKSNNLSDLTNTTTARTNLGLGSLATQSGTFSGTSSGTNTGDQIISDATLTTTDITTNNVSITKHGFVPKAPNNTTQFLRGDGTWGTPASGGLTYFTEAQATSSPNATVNVDSLTAVASTTNADFAIQPKGTGAILAQVPDGTPTGGDKRGQYAVDFQRFRQYTGTYVASGNYSVLMGGSHNKATTDYASVIGGYFNTSSGPYSVTGGYQNTASGSGTVSLGYSNLASGTNAVAMGDSNTASGNYSTSFGRGSSTSGFYSFAYGRSNTASGDYSQANGFGANTFSIIGRNSFSSSYVFTTGDAQKSTLILANRTTGATPTALSVDTGVATTSNQLTLQNNNSIRFKGTIIGRQSGSTNTSAWDIDGIIQRGTSAGTTTLLISNVNVIQNTPAWGTPTLTANTTLGCLTVSVTGALATNIQWTCAIDTTEVIYA